MVVVVAVGQRKNGGWEVVVGRTVLVARLVGSVVECVGVLVVASAIGW